MASWLNEHKYGWNNDITLFHFIYIVPLDYFSFFEAVSLLAQDFHGSQAVSYRFVYNLI